MDITLKLSEQEAISLRVALKFYLDAEHANELTVRDNASIFSFLVGQLEWKHYTQLAHERYIKYMGNDADDEF